MYVETWTELLSAGVVHLRFRLTHDAADTHTPNLQELPFAYVRTPYNRVVFYGGSRPWTNDSVTIRSASLNASGENVPASERWAGLVNFSDVGLVLWAPQAYQRFYTWFFNAVGPEDATFYLVPTTVLGIGPGFVHESEAYLFAGRWHRRSELTGCVIGRGPHQLDGARPRNGSCSARVGIVNAGCRSTHPVEPADGGHEQTQDEQ